MIWIIIIVAYLLLVAMALGFTLQMDEDAKYKILTQCIFAFIVGWLIIPFAIVLMIGAIIAEKYKETE